MPDLLCVLGGSQIHGCEWAFEFDGSPQNHVELCSTAQENCDSRPWLDTSSCESVCKEVGAMLELPMRPYEMRWPFDGTCRWLVGRHCWEEICRLMFAYHCYSIHVSGNRRRDELVENWDRDVELLALGFGQFGRNYSILHVTGVHYGYVRQRKIDMTRKAKEEQLSKDFVHDDHLRALFTEQSVAQFACCSCYKAQQWSAPQALGRAIEKGLKRSYVLCIIVETPR